MPTPSHNNVPHLHDPKAREVFNILNRSHLSAEIDDEMSWQALAATPFSQRSLPSQNTILWYDSAGEPLIQDNDPPNTPSIPTESPLPAGVLSGRALVEADFPNVNSFLPCMFYGCNKLNAIYCAYGDAFGSDYGIEQLHLTPRCFLARTEANSNPDSVKLLYIGPRPLPSDTSLSLDDWEEGMSTWVGHYVQWRLEHGYGSPYRLHINALSPLDSLGGVHDKELAAAIEDKDFDSPDGSKDADWEVLPCYVHAPMLGVLTGHEDKTAEKAPNSYLYAAKAFNEICENRLRYSITDEILAQEEGTGMYFSLLPTIRATDGTLYPSLHYFNPRHFNIFPSALMVNAIKMDGDFIHLWYVDFLEGETKSESTIVLPPSPHQGKTRFLTLYIHKLFDTIVKLTDFSHNDEPVIPAPVQLYEDYSLFQFDNESWASDHVKGEVHIDSPIQFCMRPVDIKLNSDNYYMQNKYESITYIADGAIVLPFRKIEGDEAIMPTSTEFEDFWQYSIGFPNVQFSDGEFWSLLKFKNEEPGIRQHINLGIGGVEDNGILSFVFFGNEEESDPSPIDYLTCFAPSNIQSIQVEKVILNKDGWQGFSKVIFPINSIDDPRKKIPMTFGFLPFRWHGDFPDPVFYYNGTLYPRELFLSYDTELFYTPYTGRFPSVLCIKTNGLVQTIIIPNKAGGEFSEIRSIPTLRVDISNRSENSQLPLYIGPKVQVLVVVADSATKKPSEVSRHADSPVYDTPHAVVYDIPYDGSDPPPDGYLIQSGLSDDQTRLRGQSLNCKLLVHSEFHPMDGFFASLHIWWLDTMFPRSCGLWLKADDGGTNNLPNDARAYLFKFSSGCEFYPEQWAFPDGRPVVFLNVPNVKFADGSKKTLPSRFSDLWFPNTDEGVGLACADDSILLSDNLFFHIYHTRKSEIASTDAIRLDYENVGISLPSGLADDAENPLAGVIVTPYYSTGMGEFDSATRELTCESIAVTGLGDSFVLFKDFTDVELPAAIAESSPTCLVGRSKINFGNYDENSLYVVNFPTEDQKNVTVTDRSDDLKDVEVVLPKFLGNKIFSGTTIRVQDSRLWGDGAVESSTITITNEIETQQWTDVGAPTLDLGSDLYLPSSTKSLVFDGRTSDSKLKALFSLAGPSDSELSTISLGENWTWHIYRRSNGEFLNLESISGHLVVEKNGASVAVFNCCPKLATVTVHCLSAVNDGSNDESSDVFDIWLFSSLSRDQLYYEGFACNFNYTIVIDASAAKEANVNLNIPHLFQNFEASNPSPSQPWTPSVTIDLSAVPEYVVKNITFPDFTNTCGLATLNLILASSDQFPGGDGYNYTLKTDGEIKVLEVNEAAPGHTWGITCRASIDDSPYFSGNVEFTGSSGN